MPNTNNTKVKKSKRSKKSKKSSRKTKTSTPAVVATPAPVEVVEEVVEASQPTTATTERKTRTRRVVNKDSVLADIDSLMTDLTSEIEERRNDKTRKSGNTRFLRNVLKRLKVARKDVNNVAKTKKRTVRQTNKKSGFMKPVQISQQIADFAGWDAKTPRSRVDVTRYLCNYIKEKNLQKPENKRFILPDKKLKRLLKMPKGADLTYSHMQRYIQHHFTKLPVVAST